MNTVGEPHPLEIDGERLEILAFAVAGVVGVNRLQHLADAQVIAPILIPKDVASAQCGLREVIYKRLLPKRELIETMNLVAEHLQIGKTFVVVCK